LQFISPIHPPAAELTESCQAVSSYGRRHVHVFIANGVDPLCMGNLAGLRDYLTALGFPRTYYAQTYHAHWIKKHVRQARKEDHDARFVLIGYGLGAETVRAAARKLCGEGIPIDLVITLQASPNGCLMGGPAEPSEGQSDKAPCALPEEHMLGAPSDQQTLCALAFELTQVAQRVPMVALAEVPVPEAGPRKPREPSPETAPPPRPLQPGQVSYGDTGSDPLRPVGQLERYTLPPSIANAPTGPRPPGLVNPARLRDPYADEEVVDDDDDILPELPPEKAPTPAGRRTGGFLSRAQPIVEDKTTK
jgi:hypothetical protein